MSIRKERLTKTSQFAAVYEKGTSQASDLLVMKALPNGLDITRYGFTVSKRVGNAVTRNRVKRRLRACLQATSVKSGWDIVFMARSAASTADHRSIERACQDLLRRARLLEEG